MALARAVEQCIPAQLIGPSWSCRVQKQLAVAPMQAKPYQLQHALSVQKAFFGQNRPIGLEGRKSAVKRGINAAVNEQHGGIAATDLRFAVVVGRFNDIITKPLLAGALETFRRHGAEDGSIEVVWVPGSFEIPVVATALAKSGKFDAVLCIGAVIRGATTHYDAVANSAASGCLSASSSTGVPVIFGVLTCDTMEQAIDRAGGKAGNKGAESAVTAIEMGNLMQTLRDRGLAAQAWY